jgi:hypothetical protein
MEDLLQMHEAVAKTKRAEERHMSLVCSFLSAKMD